MAAKIFYTLPSGQKMPAIGFGTFDLRGDAEVGLALNTALQQGYRHIDTAFLYENEREIGRVLQQWLSSGKIRREDLFITTKLPMVGIHPERVETYMKKSLENLQLDYVDLYLIHFPFGCKVREGEAWPYLDENGETAVEPKTDYTALWKKMEAQVDAGRAKNIGLSNYNSSQISEILKTARIKPGNLQIELHVYLQQKELVDFCHKKGITVTAYFPVLNPGYNRFTVRAGYEYKRMPNLLGNQEVGKIATKHSKTPAQVVLRFLVKIGAQPIPKSSDPQRIEENINIFDFNLDESDMQILRGLDMGEMARMADLLLFKGVEKHPDYPFPRVQRFK